MGWWAAHSASAFTCRDFRVPYERRYRARCSVPSHTRELQRSLDGHRSNREGSFALTMRGSKCRVDLEGMLARMRVARDRLFD